MHRLLPASRSWHALVVAVTLAACGGGDGPPTGNNSNTPAAVTPVANTAGQQAAAGTAVTNAPAVRVTNSAGAGLSGVAVTFAVTAGGGSLASTTAQTNAQGIATAGAWTLGPAVGVNTVRATVGSLSTTINATATAGAAANIVGVNTTNLTGPAGAALATPVTVKVTDAAGNAVAGATVQFAPTTGSGTVSAASVATNASGEAQTTWTLGADAGTDQLVATVAGTSVTTTISAAATITPLVASRVDVGGVSFKCVVRTSGVVSCWGENPAGNLGDGTQTFRERPVNVNVAGLTFTNVTLGNLHGCALLAGTGVAYCWGRNSNGAVGDGTTTDRTSPVPVAEGHAFTSLGVGPAYSCGLKSDETIWCWGGSTGTTPVTKPTQLATGGLSIRAVSVTATQVCGAVRGGGTLCWPANAVFAATPPARQNTSLEFTALAGGGDHQCGLAGGRAYCWGDNAASQLGIGPSKTGDQTAPTAVVGGLTFTAIDAGVFHTCALTDAAQIYCWGDHTRGQVGNGLVPEGENGTFDVPQAVAAPSGVQFAALGAGGFASCGIAAGDGRVFCWGAQATDNSAQVVIGLTSPTPVRDQ